MPATIVTGSASGIGAAVVRVLEDSGHDVAGWDILGSPPVDVADEASVGEAAARVGEGLDAAVLAAGVSRMATLADTTADDWHAQMAVNAFGVFNCLRALAPRMRPGGSIVVISSMAGIAGAPLLSAYSASKFAAIGLVQSAALELAPAGIRVNAVCPMYVRTPMQERELVWEAKLRRMEPEEVMRGYVAGTPLGRVAEPEEVADVVAFLVGEQSRYMTGSNVTVSGGAHL
jgi:NAD(P)-dependent dehydrogenase (short-subunit alcohol dehydrogenase family)